MDQNNCADKEPYYDSWLGADGEFWTRDEIAIEVWSRLGEARRAIGPSISNKLEANTWIKWIKPGPLNPECGFRVYTPGLLRKKEFAQFVVSVLGKHFRLSCWVRKHAGQTLLNTEELGMEEDFFANLRTIAEKLTEIAVQVDDWSRADQLKESFPEEWVGPTRMQAIKSIYREYREAKRR